MTVVSARMRQVKLSPSVAARIILNQLREEGRRIIDMTIGEPDFATPDHISKAAIDAIMRGDTKYPLSQGTVALRKAAALRISLDTGLEYPLDQIIVSTGAKQVLYNALTATLEAGDEVIIPAPYWVSYPDMVELSGGVPVTLLTQAASQYKITPDALRAAITPKTKWLMLNAPSNPSGTVYDLAELAALADVLRDHPHVWIMTDDIYARLTFDGGPAPHILQAAPDLADRTLAVNGVSKCYAMTGWRIGYGSGPKDLIKAMAVVQSQSTSGACTISQAAATAALNGPQDCVEDFARSFKERRDLALTILADAPGLNAVSPDGAFYIFPDCSALLGSTAPDGSVIATDADLVQYILRKTGVALLDGMSYGVPGTFRLSFASAPDEVREGCEAIKSVCKELAENKA
ncbi:aminotransferase class I/II-fold pyridoxal phosphate-dependent enzyme [Paracoccus laeviglucosivorans]|uniref:Aminotransferase n=1 Tax=Paracoccus laeviglucosivorans TaxID=1197861 RepID=A0A521F0X8_9RHOB|nr:aminotransferase class I/II-fold pyridoxal phosphate-dependent enzyme [Paracoccus laeviglucosivorans]SMO89864.1 L-aspartate aminotransferase apoenzyme [Paracoccus laeviglucosivorans]